MANMQLILYILYAYEVNLLLVAGLVSNYSSIYFMSFLSYLFFIIFCEVKHV